jgi:serine/threonine-protein kinase
VKQGVVLRQAGTTSLDPSASLSDDFLQAAAHRLGLVCLVIAGVCLLGVVVNVVLFDLLKVSTRPNLLLNHILTVVLGVAALGVWAADRSDLAPRRVLDLGTAFQVLGAGMISTLAYWGEGDPQVAMWIGVWIVLFPLVLPAKPIRHAVLGGLCALTAPAAMLLAAAAQGAPLPDAGALIKSLVPLGLCVVLSVASGQLLYRLGKKLTQTEADARRMGSYRLVKELGAGGMGEVWLAEHHVLSRPAAIKLIKADVLAGGDQAQAHTALTRFEREARTTAALSSPHTIGLYDFGTTEDGTIYYVMELLRGIDLEQLVKRFGPVPPARAVSLLRQACDSLAEAHAADLIHRDIKPANLYLSRLGRTCDFVKVLDFGLVKQQAKDGAAGVTGQDFIVGTPAFMAPEQVAGDDGDLGPGADIYALGCVGYYLLSGGWVFKRDSAMRILMDHMQTDPEPLSERAEQDVPPELEALLMQCLAKDPAARPQSMEELSTRLEALNVRWSQAEARAWWGEHLPDLLTSDVATGPATGGVDVHAATAAMPSDGGPDVDPELGADPHAKTVTVPTPDQTG